MKKKLEIGLLVDDLKLNELNQDIISNIVELKVCDKFLLIKQNLPKSNFISYLKKYSILRLIEKALIKSIFWFEKTVLSRFFNLKYKFKRIDISSVTKEILNVHPRISKSGFFYEYNDDDIENIQRKNLDVIIRLGSGIIRGKMLSVAKNGIFSFHHGDNEFFRGGPPGFWEVYFKKPLTGFVIQQLNEVLDGGKIIFKGQVETKYFYFLNQMSIFKNSSKYLSKILIDLQNEKLKFLKFDIEKSKIYKDPKIPEIIRYILITYLNIFKKFILQKILKKRIRWNVSYKADVNIENIDLNNFKKIDNTNKDRFLADPFVIESNGKNFIFLEDFYFSKNKGVISCYEIENNNQKFLGPVLEENFHLSFPFIFKFENKIFMCPETHEKKEIRVYICEKFPLKWKMHMTLITNISAVDTIIFEKDKLWWLITCTSNNSSKDFNELNIFFSEEGPVTKNWKPHCLNPITVNPNISRNGGIIFKEDKIFRISQNNGFNFYGRKFSINEIKVLDKTNFKENFVMEFLPNNIKKIKGTHHLQGTEKFLVNDFCI